MNKHTILRALIALGACGDSLLWVYNLPDDLTDGDVFKNAPRQWQMWLVAHLIGGTQNTHLMGHFKRVNDIRETYAREIRSALTHHKLTNGVKTLTPDETEALEKPLKEAKERAIAHSWNTATDELAPLVIRKTKRIAAQSALTEEEITKHIENLR